MTTNELNTSYFSALEKIAITSFQKEALELLRVKGLPTTKQEDWIYTKLSDVLPSTFKKCNEAGVLESIKVAGKYQIVFLNGKYSAQDSFTPDGLKVELRAVTSTTDIKCLDDNKDTFALLNGAGTSEILFLTVEKNVILDDIVSIVHLSNFEESFATPRIHIHCEKFSNSNFIEIFKGSDYKKYNNISVTNLDLEAGAISTHTKVQSEGKNAFHFSSVNAVLQADASFKSFTFTTGAKKSRNNVNVRLKGMGATTSVDGLYALRGNQHSDNFTLIEHIMPHTQSTQLFKGILDDSSRGIFTGKVLVARDAQKINSEQLNKNLILSKKAHADSRPQLEVYADDVKCSHGATIGQMNPEEAFYLMSRGLSKARCQKLLIHAFCSDVLSKLDDEKVENFLSDILFESFENEVFKNIENDS